MRTVLGLFLLLAQLSAGQIDSYIHEQMPRLNLQAVSLAVLRNGKLVKTAGYGVANLEWNIPATERTVYEIGSISKHFTALAVLLLLEDNKLSLDDPIAKYVDGTPAIWKGITIRHILQHTAGLPDFDTGNIGFSYRREYTPAEFVALMAAQPLAFAPGDRWDYSNSFALLGLVVERLCGMTYAEFLTQRIFRPLGMESARVNLTARGSLPRTTGS